MSILSPSPLAPESFPVLKPIDGITLSTFDACIKYHGRDDLMMAVFQPGTTVSGVFTQSHTAAAPVLYCRKNLSLGRPRALIVNSGNANAFTGSLGEYHVEQTTQAVATAIKCKVGNVFVASTGVIGKILPIDNITSSINHLINDLSDSHWEAAARAILTTDTFPKGASVNTRIGKKSIKINGFAKGSGMIEPNMATMLAFIFTDATMTQPILQALLVEQNEISFNAITVDGDMSTNDTCLLFATGAVKNQVPKSIEDINIQNFRLALRNLMEDLATQVIRDGEGANKLIKVCVSGAESYQSAKIVAKSIANSPLVKTSMAGSDPNWGRLVMAIGKAGQTINQHTLKISIGNILITENRHVTDHYNKAKIAKYLNENNIHLRIDLGIGNGKAAVWTCDMTHGYIKINSNY